MPDRIPVSSHSLSRARTGGVTILVPRTYVTLTFLCSKPSSGNLPVGHCGVDQVNADLFLFHVVPEIVQSDVQVLGLRAVFVYLCHFQGAVVVLKNLAMDVWSARDV